MRLHHVGIVVPDLEAHAEGLRALLGAEPLAPAVRDPLQQVRLLLLSTGTEVSIELIEPAGAGSPAARALEKGGGLNHLGYAVAELDTAIRALVAAGHLLVSSPRPAVAFDGKRVAFLYTRERQLVELVEE